MEDKKAPGQGGISLRGGGMGDEEALERGLGAFRDQWKGECRKVIGVNAIHDITTRMAYICI